MAYSSVYFNLIARVGETNIIDTCYLLKSKIENKFVDMWYLLKIKINNDNSRQPAKVKEDKSTIFTKMASSPPLFVFSSADFFITSLSY